VPPRMMVSNCIWVVLQGLLLCQAAVELMIASIHLKRRQNPFVIEHYD
jgi:hypothetical protein